MSFSLASLSPEQKHLRKRVLELSHYTRLSHLGSCLSAVDVIDRIYAIKHKSDQFVLSNGHAGIAYYAVLEKYGYIKNSATLHSLRVHPDRNVKRGIIVSTGSLGQGLPIAAGLAFANRKNKVYCMISDGETTEGSIWETFRIMYEKQLTNMQVIVNANGWSAYDTVNIPYLIRRIKSFGLKVQKIDGHNIDHIDAALQSPMQCIIAQTSVEQFSFLHGQDAHYYVMTDRDYEQALEQLS